MENDNRLDLTLSLPFGGPSTSKKGKSNNEQVTRAEKDDRGSKLIDDFKNFLDGGTYNEDTIVGSQRINQSKPEDNLFYDLSKENAKDASSNIHGGFWGKNDAEIQEEMRQEAGSKRKNLFDEINHQKMKTSHISITTDECSTAENEDVADSEAEGETSKLIQHHDDASKRHSGSAGLPGGSNVNAQGQSRFSIGSEKDFKVGHVSYGVPFSGQSVNILNMPYPFSMKEPNSNSITGTQQFHPSYFGRGIPNSNKQNDGLKITQATMPVNAVNSSERTKGNGKHAKEEGSSLHTEGGMKGINGIGTAKSTGDQTRAEGCPPEFPALRPGIAAELKFGGSGSSPNLPWVSTTGAGPNGKTISGVTYKYSGTQIRVVCACHGSHMSPEEFVHHASEEQPDPNGGGGSALASFPNGNQAASAQS